MATSATTTPSGGNRNQSAGQVEAQGTLNWSLQLAISQRAEIDRHIASLTRLIAEGNASGGTQATPAATTKSRPRRKMSEAARKHLSEAMKRRHVEGARKGTGRAAGAAA